MKQHPVILLAVVAAGAALGLWLSRMTPAPAPDLAGVQQLRLRRAMLELQAEVSSLSPKGDPVWRLSAAVGQLAESLNTSQRVDAEEAGLLRQAGVADPSPITVVLWKPTEPWQLVLIPDDVYQIVRIEAYGKTLARPVMATDVRPSG